MEIMGVRSKEHMGVTELYNPVLCQWVLRSLSGGSFVRYTEANCSYVRNG